MNKDMIGKCETYNQWYMLRLKRTNFEIIVDPRTKAALVIRIRRGKKIEVNKY